MVVDRSNSHDSPSLFVFDWPGRRVFLAGLQHLLVRVCVGSIVGVFADRRRILCCLRKTPPLDDHVRPKGPFLAAHIY